MYADCELTARRAGTTNSPAGGRIPVPGQGEFPASFAGDVKPETAAFMEDSQVPWGVEALNGTTSEPAWKTKPSWCLLSREDEMIPLTPSSQCLKRAGSTVVGVKASHSVYFSQPQAVAALIDNMILQGNPRKSRSLSYGKFSQTGTWYLRLPGHRLWSRPNPIWEHDGRSVKCMC